MLNYKKFSKNYINHVKHPKVKKLISFNQTNIFIPGTDDQRKGTQLLEVYALEIQMHTLQKNTKKLKQLYELSLHIKAAIPHPLIMGLFI
jgi:COP9 signalosome complex subunit 2